MIRIVALGVIGLAGVAAIGPAAKNPASPLPVASAVHPIVASDTKADRLPLKVHQAAPAESDGAALAYGPPDEKVQYPPVEPAQQQAADPPPSRIVSRHWHDPDEHKAKAAKRRAIRAAQARKRADDAPQKQAEAKTCRTDGLHPLLARLNLAPRCDP